MALSIKSVEADRLARELAAVTGESLTTAVINALRERLDRERGGSGDRVARRLRALQSDLLRHKVLDTRSADEIIGYDDGPPR
ncbi:type II toxin-antitoxin system VapB family antitoxin [Jiangella anatolica]|uniref:PSK operon transcription factor n=1 Tax=Jiangella anatolica TaxID=2670374 RepID=A0A2W2BNU8_9ACTN|nr:type II toxin-antitoxin system VapB family antitoxin [Jiangella anatolica]PZF81868.1 PSK operon transcription factor [Jiangella anatolica]